MNEDGYYQTLALTPPLRERIAVILGQMRAFCPEEIKDIFVSDIVQQDGTRSYPAIWAFSDAFIMEGALAPEDVVRFDIIRHRGALGHLVIIMKDLQWQSQPVESSRLTVEANFVPNLGAHLQAAGANCDALRQVCVRYLIKGWPV